MDSEDKSWDIEIRPRNKTFSLNIKEIWKYRDLLQMYVKRDVTTMYKQTILGPLWFIIQPLFTTITFMFIFGNIAKISTDGLPQILFYLCGLMGWNYFAECLGRTSSTFMSNAGVFSKVYFPRLVVPISSIISTLIKLGIQMLLFLVIYLYYYLNGANVQPNIYILLFPLLVAMLGGLAMGFGIIISALTTKYRDLALFFGFVTQLWMYATPIIYPLSAMPAKYMWLIELNPLTSIIETMRYGFMGAGTFNWGSLLYSLVFTIVIVVIGAGMFNKVERSFVDVV